VTEALQRVPGVSINRFAAGVDPDHFSVEGSGVVVRGLNFVRSELNGRDTFSANNGRALSFADVPSELMGGVDVFKSPSADRSKAASRAPSTCARACRSTATSACCRCRPRPAMATSPRNGRRPIRSSIATASTPRSATSACC
jgi:hypothetical protein